MTSNAFTNLPASQLTDLTAQLGRQDPRPEGSKLFVGATQYDHQLTNAVYNGGQQASLAGLKESIATGLVH